MRVLCGGGGGEGGVALLFSINLKSQKVFQTYNVDATHFIYYIIKRQDQRLVLFYKIINRLASVETEDILTPADSRTRKNYSFKFKHLQANCDSYRVSFFQPLFRAGTTFHLALRRLTV